MVYDIIVVGGGHAGCEASFACSKMNHKTLLITSNIKNLASLPCNPSIGGSAKGIVVREIDALGGIMGKIADKAQIQMKLLNRAKGPAVRSLRAQIDRTTYYNEMLKTLKAQPNLEIMEAMVEDLVIENNVVKGVILDNDEPVYGKVVILTTGTYLKSDILLGSTRTRSGPLDEKPSLYLSDNLKKYGFQILRLKTGTPQRIKKDSIDLSKTKIEKGDNELLSFSYDRQPNYKIEDQEPCYLLYTTPQTHKIINENLTLSSMYGGLSDILGVGPRYCPSIEDKIVRFKEKEKHQLFLEPEGKNSPDMYLQGFSTSMPREIQEQMVHSLPGLEHAIITKYAYAIEYDAIRPTQIKPSLETKIISNLYTAGQINGTSGYEEAAGQGLMAGINASLNLRGIEPLILKRSEAYIGVLIDDLVTKGTIEPYRLLTSRAEYRLLLRDDNADLRLRGYGYEVGLIDEKRYKKLLDKEQKIDELTEVLKTTHLKEYGTNAYALLKRPEVKIGDVKEYVNEKDLKILEQVEINIKYEGYIKKTIREAEKMIKNENKLIPHDINYNKIPNLATEARQKLNQVRPLSIGQALRISGVNPSDISILSIYLRKYYPNE
ncbi:MAG: tRNA uridine-5-carboxymethylaminomethyl(34) synthesis enzyme MnmG [Bacilli bacterium]|nr:tRNA uridine-5-carboxymethylaminomethyl(34) synthesis enzyme MnmG [Bacilli bacterium]